MDKIMVGSPILLGNSLRYCKGLGGSSTEHMPKQIYILWKLQFSGPGVCIRNSHVSFINAYGSRANSHLLSVVQSFVILSKQFPVQKIL